jgi:hypothetical protein
LPGDHWQAAHSGACGRCGKRCDCREASSDRRKRHGQLLNGGPGVSRTQFSPLRPAVPRCSVEPVNERQGHRGPALRKSAVVRTKSILSAADVPLFSGLHVRDQRRSLAARFAQLASGRRGVGGERHTAVPHDASFDSQAPAPTFGTNPEAEGHRQHSLIRARAAAQASGYLFDLDTFWGTRATPTYRRHTIGAIRCARTTPLARPPPVSSLRCCGRSSAGCSGRPRSPRLAAMRVAQSW